MWKVSAPMGARPPSGRQPTVGTSAVVRTSIACTAVSYTSYNAATVGRAHPPEISGFLGFGATGWMAGGSRSNIGSAAAVPLFAASG